MRKFVMVLAGMLALAACRNEVLSPVMPPEMPMEASCGAQGLQSLIGQDKSVLATMRLSQTFRVIEPGMAVTMDYSPQRLNIHVDKSGKIVSLNCA